jgi:hypothetical protein
MAAATQNYWTMCCKRKKAGSGQEGGPGERFLLSWPLSLFIVLVALAAPNVWSTHDYENKLLLLSSNSNNLKLGAPWVSLVRGYDDLYVESNNGNAYDFQTNKLLCTSHCVEETERIFLKGVVVVEDFTSTTSISRNMIQTFKNENTKEAKRYRQILDIWNQKDGSQHHQEHELFFLVAHLSCESISKVLMNRFGKAIMDTAEIHLCKSSPKRRQKWFANFAYLYGVVGGDISPQACFIDLQPLAGRIDLSQKWRSSGAQLCVQAKELKIHIYANQVASLPLSIGERNIYRKNIVDALQKKPSDRYSCFRLMSTWLPWWLVSRMKAVLPNDCWKKSFISVHYPDFHLAVIGGHGVGKSTFMQWLMFYSGIKRPAFRNYDAFGVCPPSAPSCTLKYGRERFSSSHFFYDTKGLQDLHKDYAKSVADLMRGKSTPVGSKMAYIKNDGNTSTGTTWLFSSVWNFLVGIWRTVEVVFGITILLVAILWVRKDPRYFHRRLLDALNPDEILSQRYKWQIASFTILIAISYNFTSTCLWLFLVITEIVILLVAIFENSQNARALYVSKVVLFVLGFWTVFFVFVVAPFGQTDDKFNEGDVDAKVHAFALLTRFPGADTEFTTLNKFILELKNELDGYAGVENFAVAITSNEHCMMTSVEECHSSFETRLGGHLGTTKLLDIVEKPNILEGGYSKIQRSTGVFLEPDRIFFLLEDLQNRALVYFENSAEWHYEQASSLWGCLVLAFGLFSVALLI